MRDAEMVTFGNSDLDRAAHLRRSAAALFEQDHSRAIVLWRGKPLVDMAKNALCRLAHDHPLLAEATRVPVFLGLDSGQPVFAVDISPWEPDDLDAGAMATFFDTSENQHPMMANTSVSAIIGCWFSEVSKHVAIAPASRSSDSQGEISTAKTG